MTSKAANRFREILVRCIGSHCCRSRPRCVGIVVWKFDLPKALRQLRGNADAAVLERSVLF